MIYHSFQSEKLSALGLGCMRFPTVDGDRSRIDTERATAIVRRAYEGGINYFDVAWGYHGGNAEAFLGEALTGLDRASLYIATKFPGYDAECCKNPARVFEEQLRRLRTEYVDFYLFHSVTEANIEGYLDPAIHAYFAEQKKNGRIKHLGFSSHCDVNTMRRFYEMYGDLLEFAQIQLNYVDYFMQEAKDKVAFLREKHLPIWVMEPVRGGSLANIPAEEAQKLIALRPNHTPVAFAFRFLEGIPDVTVTLSGMSTMEQLEENLVTFAESQPLTPAEEAVLFTVSDRMIKEMSYPCTACRYCTTYCPQSLQIPDMIDTFKKTVNTTVSHKTAAKPTEDGMNPDRCLSCHACEKVCPQKIAIASFMKQYSAATK